MAIEKSVPAAVSTEESFGASSPAEDSFGVTVYVLFGLMVIPVLLSPFTGGSTYSQEESAGAVARVEESFA